MWCVFDDFNDFKLETTKRRALNWLWDEGSFGWYIYNSDLDETIYFEDLF